MWPKTWMPTVVFAAGACSVGGPTIDPLDDQVVAVGQELSVLIQATSPDGDPVSYSFGTNAPDLDDRALMTQRPDGTGLFRFRPTAQDIGSWVFDFRAADGNGENVESIVIDVRSAVGSNTIPLFRRPMGAGTVLDSAQDDCVEVQIETSDQDSLEVTLAEEEPLIEGAQFLQSSSMTGVWRWCPTATQRAAKDRYLLTLSADDGENPKAIKRYQIILRGDAKQACEGQKPLIEHVPENVTSVNDLEITADVVDDAGLKAAPLLYYSTEPPSDPPDLSAMIQLNMSLDQGDQRNGRWKTKVPNPLARSQPGTTQDIHYVLVAEDNDDGLGECDHLVYQTYTITVSTPGGDGNQQLCTACTADNQCGESDDLCLRVGVEGEAFCMQGCTDNSCPDGYVCSSAELESVDGASGRQCIPIDEQCEEQRIEVCDNDRFEPSDSPAAAQAISAGTIADLQLCPVGDFGTEDDWYSFEVTSAAQVDIQVSGAPDPDIDLDLLDSEGNLVALTWDWGSEDRISKCLAPGTYSLRVFSFFKGENTYSVSLTSQPGTCGDELTCTDDAAEDDDNTATATYVDLSSDTIIEDRQICEGDDDWYEVYMFSGETMYVTATFDMASYDEDLDLMLYDTSGNPISRCSEEEPWECTSNGQTGTANEQLVHTAESGGRFFVVVHGWWGSENDYDLCVSLDPAACPLP